MKVTAPDDFSWVTPLARGVTEGEEVEVDADVATSLIAAGWKPVKPKREATKEPDE